MIMGRTRRVQNSLEVFADRRCGKKIRCKGAREGQITKQLHKHAESCSSPSVRNQNSDNQISAFIGSMTIPLNRFLFRPPTHGCDISLRVCFDHALRHEVVRFGCTIFSLRFGTASPIVSRSPRTVVKLYRLVSEQQNPKSISSSFRAPESILSDNSNFHYTAGVETTIVCFQQV